MLRRIEEQIKALTGEQGRSAGYLADVRVVRFNAWQYAEVNMWACLVNEVLQEIGPAVPVATTSATQDDELAEVADTAVRARAAVERKAADVVAAERTLRATESPLRRWALRLGAGIVALVAGAVAVALLTGASATLVAGYGAALTAIGALVGAIAEVRQQAQARTTEVAAAAQDAGRALRWFRGVAGARAAAERDLLVRRSELQAAQKAWAEVEAEVAERRRLVRGEHLGAVLHRMSSVTEYREQLSLVTRTRERFAAIDKAVTHAREGCRATARDTGTSEIERVVILVDDLDRCPPEKVVAVLEATHLLFDFEMFVVVLAVDTRWLEQSLRLHYRGLLGESGAGPPDYLEKIIQIPLQLRSLDEELVRGMVAGLTGVAPTSDPAPPDAVDAVDPAEQHARPDATPARTAIRPRPARVPEAETLTITPAEATAMAGTAALLGTTPRTVKRYVNIYRLLKARSTDPSRFDEARDGLGDHQITAFLLAVLTGHPHAAGGLFTDLVDAVAGRTVGQVVAPAAYGWQDTPSGTAVRKWVSSNPDVSVTPAERLAPWVAEVSRYSFATPGRPT